MFQKVHIPKKGHSKNGTFQKEHIPKYAHSKGGFLKNPEFLSCLIFSRQLWCNQMTILLANWLYEGKTNLWDWRTMSSHLYLLYNCMYSGIPFDDYRLQSSSKRKFLSRYISHFFTYICPKVSTYIPQTLGVQCTLLLQIKRSSSVGSG